MAIESEIAIEGLNQEFIDHINDVRNERLSQYGVSLTPLKALQRRLPKRDQSFYTFDTETKDGLKGKQIYCWSLAYAEKGGKDGYSLRVLQDYENFAPLFEFFLKHKKKKGWNIVYVHNLGFDIRFLIDYAAKQKIEYFPIVSGSNMVCCIFRDYGVKFVDTFQFLWTSQDKAEIEWEIPENYRKINCVKAFETDFQLWGKLKAPQYTNRFGEKKKGQSYKKWVYDHNANDVLALWEIMHKLRIVFFEVANVDVLQCITLANFSMKAMRKRLKDKIANPFIHTEWNEDGTKKEYHYDEKLEEFVRSSYFGGRCEIFDSNLHGKSAYVDRVSMYPSEMYNKKYPIGIGRLSYDYNEMMNIIEGKTNIEGFIEVECTPNQFTTNYPILAEKRDGKTMFTNCYRKGVYTIPELKLSLKMGYVIRPLRGLLFDESDYIFRDFVDEFFKVKSTAKGGRKECAKRVLNSSYGKFGQAYKRAGSDMHYFTTEDEMLDFLHEVEDSEKFTQAPHKDNELWIVVEGTESIMQKPFMIVGIASYITAYARLALWEILHYLEEKGVNVYYTDTDSFTLDYDYIEKLEQSGLIGDKLGDWQIEQAFEQVKFIAPKCYISLQKGKDGIVKSALKLKGVDKSKMDEIKKEADKLPENERMAYIEKEIRLPIELAEKYMTFNQAHRSGLILNTKKITKHYSFKNGKRNFMDGSSIAWNDETLPSEMKC